MGKLIKRRKKPKADLIPYSVLYQKRYVRESKKRVMELREKAMVSRERQMTFGKYKGRKLKEMDREYMQWLYYENWFPEQHPRIHKHVDILMRYSFVRTALQFYEDELQDLLKVREDIDRQISEVMGWIHEEKEFMEADYE